MSVYSVPMSSEAKTASGEPPLKKAKVAGPGMVWSANSHSVCKLSASSPAQPPPPAQKVLLCSELEAIKTAGLTRALGRHFKLRFSKIAADFIVPGLCTTAFAAVHESEILFHAHRTKTVDRQVQRFVVCAGIASVIALLHF